jgi:hypothetical protein
MNDPAASCRVSAPKPTVSSVIAVDIRYLVDKILTIS